MNIVFYKDEFTDESKYDEFSDNVCDILRAINPDVWVAWTSDSTEIDNVSMSDGDESTFYVLIKYAKKMGYERI